MSAKNDLVFVPCVSISPGKIVAYSQVLGLKRGGRRGSNDSPAPVAKPEPNNFQIYSLEWMEREAEITTYNDYVKSVAGHANLKLKKDTGVMSIAAKKRIRAAINAFYVLSDEKRFGYKNRGRFKLNFITLTLASQQMHSDDFIKKNMLNRFLEDMRRQHGLKSYIWRAEIQTERTNNIHFHLTFNIYIDHKVLRDAWNRIQAMYGYIDAFEQKWGHRDPNSTDVHAINDVKNIAAYVSEYMAKSEGARPISGRQWFLSSNLSKVKPVQLEEWPELAHEISDFTALRKKDFVKYDYASVAYVDIFTADLAHFPALANVKKEFFDRYHHLVN